MLLEQRMRIAFALFEQWVDLAGVVAARLGYAFKRRFGQTPSAVTPKPV